MTNATAGDGELGHLRVIVYPEGDLYVAQCLEVDIATQAHDIPTVLERLDLTLDAECAISRDSNESLLNRIAPAPNYFHGLWEKRAVTLTHLSIPVRQHLEIEVGLAQKMAA
jgi:hypothetical protein